LARPVTSDADGRFSLHGVGPGFRAFLTVHDPRFSTKVIEINSDAIASTKPLSFAL
jgi:hypothetical protein